MKRTLEILLIGLMAGGLLTGCPKKDGGEETPATATQTETNNTQTAAQETETAEQEEEKVEVDQENYTNALFEVSCVRAKVEDTEQQKSIIDEVYARYGFDAESFAAAQEAMKDKSDISTAVESKMETCTAELAAGFAKAGADGTNAGSETNAGDGEEKKEAAKKPAKKWKSGGYADNGVTGGGLEMGKLRINITDDGKVTGAFQGKREGKGFSIPLKGEISKDGSFKASGNKGPNNARINGRFKSGTLTGAIQGSINKKGYRVNFNAK